MSYLGDLPPGGSLTLLFTTVNTAGVPASLTASVGQPVGEVGIYKDTLDSIVLSGITFSADFDGRVGLHAVGVQTAAAPTFYTSGSMYSLILSSGFLAGVGSLSNSMLGNFSINARSGLRPEVAGRTLALTPAGQVGINWANIANSATVQALTGTTVKAVDSNVTVGTNNDKTGYALGSNVTVGINNDKTGYALGIGGFIAGAAAVDSFTDTAASALYTSEIAIAVGNHEVETVGHYTADQVGRVILAALAGITDTGGLVFRTPDGTVIRITATVDGSNNRTSITLTP